MAKGGELRLLDDDNRPYASFLAFTHSPAFAKVHAQRGITPPLQVENNVADVEPVTARIQDDTWIAVCPDCGGGEVVWPSVGVIWCHGCGNARLGGKYRRTVLPQGAQAAEAVLDKRAIQVHRNWDPETESIDDLRKQNVEAGEPV